MKRDDLAVTRFGLGALADESSKPSAWAIGRVSLRGTLVHPDLGSKSRPNWKCPAIAGLYICGNEFPRQNLEAKSPVEVFRHIASWNSIRIANKLTIGQRKTPNFRRVVRRCNKHSTTCWNDEQVDSRAHLMPRGRKMRGQQTAGAVISNFGGR